MLSFGTVFPGQMIGITIAFMFKGERKEAEVQTLKYQQNQMSGEVNVRVRDPKGKYYWLPLDEPFDVIRGRAW
jgi:hypothetical protein